LLSLWGVASPSLLNYGGAGLDSVGGHAGASARPHESGAHDGGGACDISCAQGPRISCSSGAICGSKHSVLHVRVRCAIILVPPLSAAIL
jgi:hypothetical protein